MKKQVFLLILSLTLFAGKAAADNPGLPINFTFPAVSITLTSAGSTENQIVCINAAIVNITYSVSQASGVTITGLPTGVSGNWAGGAGGTVTISGSPSVSVASPYSYDIQVDGPSGPVHATGTITVTPTVGTPTSITVSGGSEPTCQLTNGTTTTTYSTTATDHTSFNWSLSNGSAGSIGAATGIMTWTDGFSGTVDIQVIANGCNGPSSQVTRTVNITPTVGTPVFTMGATSSRCKGAGTVTYTADATNKTGISYSLDGLSVGGGNSIDAGTGEVTYDAAWSGTSIITATATGCNGPTQATHTVTIDADKPATPLAPTPDANPVCQSQSAVTYSVALDATVSAYTWNFDAGLNVTPTSSTNLHSITVNFSATSVSGNVTVTASNSCGDNGASPSLAIIVNTLPVPTINGLATVCQGASSVTYTTESSMTNYVWTISSGGNIDGGSGTNQITVTWNTVGAQNVSVNYKDLNSCSASIPTVLNVTVVGDPTLDQPSDVTICKGGSTVLTTSPTGGTGTYNYQWEFSADGSTLWAPVADATPTGITYTNANTESLTITGNGSEASDAKYYKCLLTTNTPAGAGCDAATTPVTVTTVADPSLTAPTALTTICKGGNATVSTTASGGTGGYNYQWEYSANGTTGWAAVVDATPSGITYTNGTTSSLTVTGNGTEAVGDKFYRCVLSSTTASVGCDAVSSNAQITTVADPSLTAPTALTTICKGGNATVSTTASGGTGGYNYQWEYSANGTTGWAAVVDATPSGITYTNGTTSSLTVTGNGTEAVGDKFYRCVLSSTTASVGCDAVSSNAQITTVADPSLTAPTALTTICKGGNATVSTTASGGTGGYNYQWEYSANGTTGWAAVVDATPSGITYTNGTTSSLTVTGNGTEAVGDKFYRCVLSSTTASVGCDAVSSNAQITTVADPSLTAPTALTTICKGGNATVSTTASGGTGGYNYQWEYSANGTTGWAAVVDATPSGITYTNGTTSSLTVTGNGTEAVGDKFYRCVLSSTTASVGCDAVSSNAQITTVADPSLTAPTALTTICKGGNATVSTTASGGTGGYNYQWEYSANGTTGWAAVVDATPSGITYTNGTTSSLTVTGNGTEAVGDKFYRCVLSSTTASVGCDAVSSNAQITTVADPSLTAPTALTTICKGGNATVSTTASGGTGGYNYQWEYSANGTTGWAAVVDATPSGITYTNGTTSSLTVTGNGTEAVGDKFYRCVLSSTTASVGCDAVSSNAQITTVADPSLTAPTALTTICKGGNATVSTTASGGTGGYNYQWEYSANGTTGWAAVVDATPSGITYTNGTTSSLTVTGNGTEAVGDKFYRCVLSSTTASVGCDAVSSNAQITTVDDPNITTQPVSPANICSGGTTSNITIAAAGGTPSLIYHWQYFNGSTWNNVVNGTPTGAVYSGATGTSFSIAGMIPDGAFQYQCQVSANGSDCATVTSNPVTITVTPLPTLSGASQAAAVCETHPATINLTGLLPGSISKVDYTIDGNVESQVNTGTATGAGAASITTRTLTAADNGKTLSITGLTTTNATPNCSKTFSQNLILIVNTASTPTLTGNLTPCVSSTQTYTTESGMQANSYLWSVSAGGTITGGGTSTDNTVTVLWNTAGSRTVSVNYTNTNGCIALSPTVKTITVQSLPVPVLTGPASACVNSAGNIYTTDAGMLSYAWTVPTGGTITTGGSGNLIIVTWNTSGSQTVNVNYTNTNGCTASSPTAYGVTVNPLPVPTVSGPATPRVNSTGNVYSTESGMTGYTWNISGGGAITSGTGTNSVNVTWNTTGAQTISVNYTNSNSCTAVSPTIYSVTVKPLPVASSASITGTPAVGSLLTGHYTYTDGSGGTETGSTYRWLRNGTVPISGATAITYTPSSSDVDQTITFEVTPTSSVGPPYSGSPVQSSPTLTVEILVGVPVADQVCIEGIRAAGDTIKGKYRYTYAYKGEGISTYQWYLNNNPISGATGLQYIIQPSDISSGQEIAFEVTPVSSNHVPRTGLAVKSNPLARIKLTQLSYSLADPPFTLVANVGNGIFSGQGVSNGKFSPAIADTIGSPHNVNYLLNIVNSSTSCSQQDNVSIIVVAIKAYFVGLNPIYCYDGQPFTVTATNIPSGSSHFRFWNSNNNSIIDSIPSLHKVVIDPSKMRHNKTIDTLYFSYYNNSSYFPISQAYQIDSVGVASINNLLPNSVFCNNDAQRVLFPSLTGPGGVGVFKGPVTDSIFKPSLFVGDTAVIFTYTHTNSAHCFSTVRVPVRINPAPVVSFKPLAVCVATDADTTKFLNKTTSSDSVVTWQWQFFDGGGSSTNGLRSPGYLYKNGGSNHVILTATTDKNCSAQKDSTINIGFKPVTNFYWTNECYHPNDSILFFDATSSKNATILSRTWKFQNSSTDTIGGPLDTKKNVKHLKPPSGYFPVKYIVRTGFSNCNDSITKSIYIRPTVSLTSADYFQDFESGNGGWVKDYNTANTWTFGKPDRIVINSASSGVNAWFTSYDTLKQSVDSSSVISPCFDFSAVQRPMISMELFKRFDLNRDGAVLQYKIKDSTWVNVGTLNDGINWYNSSLIKGNPGANQVGWTTGPTGQDVAWGQSSHTLDVLSGKKDVKFRIAYGSNGTGQNNEGIAFDDIRIGQRTRKVLLEHFTNLSSKLSSSSNTTVTGLAARNIADVINIQYHTNFPGADAYYNDNPGDASARFLFYGLSRAPYSFIDGGTHINFANVYDYVTTPIDSNDLARRSMINPSFAITLNSTVAGGIITVNGQIKALQAINAQNVTLFVAVTEKKNNSQTGAAGEKIFYNIFRKFIPDAAGINLQKVWAVNDTYTLSDQTWPIAKIPNSSDIEVIAFLQNNITKEIYQAQSNLQLNILVGIENISANNGKGFALYPNPASDKLTISFENALQAETDIIIYDFKGTVIKTYKAGSGESEFTINDLGLKNGIYLVRIKSGGLDWGFRKLIISKI